MSYWKVFTSLAIICSAAPQAFARMLDGYAPIPPISAAQVAKRLTQAVQDREVDLGDCTLAVEGDSLKINKGSSFVSFPIPKLNGSYGTQGVYTGEITLNGKNASIEIREKFDTATQRYRISSLLIHTRVIVTTPSMMGDISRETSARFLTCPERAGILEGG